MAQHKFKIGDKVRLVTSYALPSCRITVGSKGRVTGTFNLASEEYVGVIWEGHKGAYLTRGARLRSASVIYSKEFSDENKQKERL